MSSPDLFVVCKNCGSEVSPYVTECPYCGQRVRKRAPKLERDDPESEARPKRRRRQMPSLPRLRAGEIEGIAPDSKPVATLVLIVASMAVSVVLAASDSLGFADVGGLVIPFDEQPWRYLTTPFVHDSLAYQFAALVAVGVFGTMLERRFGWYAPILIFLGAGAAGAAAAQAVDLGPVGESNTLYVVLGANGSALGMLAAWLVNDRMAARRGDDRGNDLIGVAAIGLVLLLLPLAMTEANPVAGVVGALTGAVLGLLLTVVRRA